jgi:hypothetical protein
MQIRLVKMAGACSKPFFLVTEELMSELIDNSDAANSLLGLV